MMIREDATLDEIRDALVADLPANAAFDGWSDAARDMAADANGVDRGVAKLAFPGGAVDMIDAWFAHVDRQMAEALPVETLAAMKIRARITALIEARLSVVAPDREALRRALAVLALPQNLGRAAGLGWRAADMMWRQAGDTATDINHYTKRTTLLAIYAATMTVFLDDQSEGWAETRAFLARRIEGLMRFEALKAGIAKRAAFRPSLTRFIGRLRYPVV